MSNYTMLHLGFIINYFSLLTNWAIEYFTRQCKLSKYREKYSCRKWLNKYKFADICCPDISH